MDDDAMAAFGLSRSGDDEDPAPQSCPAPRQPAAGPAAKTGGSEAMWRHAMGERSTAVGTLARVRAPKGVRLRSRPAPGAPELGVLRFDELISVERRTEHGWCWVIPTGPLAGIPGFCEEQHLSLDPPEPTAHLHHVEPGDSLRELAARHYGKQLRDGRDARLYVQALYEANKNHKGVYLTEVKLDSLETLHRWEDDERTLEIFQGAKVREGHAIWMPSEAFIEQLRASGAIAGGSSGFSQAWSGAVAAVGHVASAATYGSAFLVGLLEGAWSSVVDLFEGAAEMLELVGTLALRLLTGNPGAIKAMLLGWVDKLEVAWAGRDKLADDFMKKWQSDDAWTRGNFQGEVLGWVMMTALLILVTSGASSVAAATGKWASVLRVLGAAEALGDVVTYASKLGRLPGKAIAFVRRRFGKAAGKATEKATEKAAGEVAEVGAVAGERTASEASAAKLGSKTDEVSEVGEVSEVSEVGSNPAAAKPDVSAETWLDQLKTQLTPDELAQYARMKGKWASPEEMQRFFDGDLDSARRDIAREASKRTDAEALKKASASRAEEIRKFVQERGLMQDERILKILERISANPSKSEISETAFVLRNILTSELRAEEIAARYPGAQVLREVQIWEADLTVPLRDVEGIPGKAGQTFRRDSDGTHRIYKNVTDIDLMVIDRPLGGDKAKILRLEQQKTGGTDTASAAKAQNEAALTSIQSSQQQHRIIRLEIEGKLDIIEQLDLTSIAQASKVTVGPAGKSFDESLGITAPDLERLMKDLVANARKEKAQ